MNNIDNQKSLVFAEIPTYLNNDFNNETIFSEEVNDFPRAVRYFSNKKIYAERIYRNKSCDMILNFKDGKLYSYRPDRSKKIQYKTKQELFKKYPEKINIKDFKNLYIYKFEENKGIIIRKIMPENINLELSKIFSCS